MNGFFVPFFFPIVLLPGFTESPRERSVHVHRRPGEHWIGHASSAWSQEHLADDPERVKEKLLKAFHESTGVHVQPVYVERIASSSV